jgi:uncharacterized membrane protein YidH (DUF202 family)
MNSFTRDIVGLVIVAVSVLLAILLLMPWGRNEANKPKFLKNSYQKSIIMMLYVIIMSLIAHTVMFVLF